MDIPAGKLEYIGSILHRFYEQAKSANKLGDTAHSKLIESMFCRELFPLIFTSCAFVQGERDVCNRKAIDLVDDANKCVYQITTQSGVKKKVEETIKKFEGMSECLQGYKLKILFFRYLNSTPQIDDAIIDKIKFDVKNDIWDLTILRQFIKEAGIDAVNECETLCRKYAGEHIEPKAEEIKLKETAVAEAGRGNLRVSEYYVPRVVSVDNKINKLCDLIEESEKIVLLGGAGSGKTEEIKNLNNLLSNIGQVVPFYFELKNYNGDSIDSIVPDDLKNKKNVVLLFDAYDEIQSEQNLSDKFTKALNLYCTKYPLTRIIVSSRLNFYNYFSDDSQAFTGFTRAYMTNFGEPQIADYLGKRLKGDKDTFIAAANKANIYPYLFIPFYLVSFVDLYLQKKTVPEKHKLMEMIFEATYEKDKSKLQGTTDKIKRDKLFSGLSKIALTLTHSGVAEVDETELLLHLESETINNFKNFSLLNYSNEKFSFIHNNFKEYFAAIELFNLSEEDLIKYVTVEIGDKYIKPKFYNTVSFLFDMKKDENTFVEFLFVNGKEILINADNAIDSTNKLRLLKSIIEEYKTKRSWIDSGRYNASLLAKLVVSPSAIDYLIECISAKEHRTTIITVMEIFRDVVCYYSKEGEILANLEAILNRTKDGSDSSLVGSCLRCMALIGLGDEKAKKLYLKYSASKYSAIRAGANYIVYKNNLGEFFVEKLLKSKRYSRRSARHISKDVENDVEEDIQYADEDFYIQAALKNIVTLDALAQWGECILIDERQDNYKDDNRQYFEKILNLETLNEKVIVVVYKALLLSARFKFRNCKDILREIIIKHNLRVHYFEKIVLSTIMLHEKLELYALLFDDSIADKILKIFQTKKDYYDFADRFITYLSWYKKEDIEKWIKYFNTNSVPCKIQVDHYEAKRIKMKTASFEALFDEVATKEEIRKIFKFKNNKPFKYKEIERRLFRDYPTFVWDYFRDGDEHIYTIEELEKVDLTFFRVHHIYDLLREKGSPLLVPNDSQISFLQAWVDEAITKFSFKNAITYKEGNSFSILSYAVYCDYFITNYNIMVSNNIYEDMVYYNQLDDNYNDDVVFDFLENKLGKDLLIQKSIEAVNSNRLRRYELIGNINYCAKNAVREVLSKILSLLKEKSKLLDYFGVRKSLIDYLIAIQEVDNALYFFDDFDIETKKEITFRLTETGKFSIAPYIEKEITANNETSIYFAGRGLLIGNKSSFEYYLKWTKENGKLYHSDYFRSPLGEIRHIESIEYIFKLMELCHEFNIKDRFRSPIHYLVESLEHIAKQSFENLAKVATEFGNYIAKSKNKDMTYYHWSIENMVFNFLKNNPDI